MNARKVSTRLLSFLLAFCMVFGMLPVTALTADAAEDAHYLVFATDRHTTTSGAVESTVFPAVLTTIADKAGVDYVCLGGDMVDRQNEYSTATILKEAQSAVGTLDASTVQIVAGNHDEGCSDALGMFFDESKVIKSGDDYYVYGVTYADVNSASSAQSAAGAFASWAEALTDNKVIVVMSHMPLHEFRNDNKGASYWHEALNAAALDENGNLVRDIVFLHGHNHTEDKNNYQYAVGEGYTIEDNTAVTNYYTYGTAGYLRDNKEATLVAIDDSTITLTRYNTSGDTSWNTTINRVVTETHEHSYTSSVTKEATCTEAGVMTYTCECGDSYTEEIAIVDHSYEDGVCSVCGAADPDYVAPTTSEPIEESTTETTEGSTDGTETAKTVSYMTISEGSGVAYVVGDKQILYKMYVSYTDGTSGYATQDDCALTIYNESGVVVTEAEALSTVGTYSADVTYMDNTCGTRLTFTVSASGDSAYELLNLVINGATLTANVTEVDPVEMEGVTDSVAYNISATVAEGETATVSIPVPADWTVGELNVYCIVDGAPTDEVFEGTYENGYYTFTTTHFSTWQLTNKEQEVEGSETTVEKEVYVLVDTPTAGNQYIIVNTNTAGSGYALKENTTTGSSITVNAAGNGISAPYIETTDETIMWNAASGMTFQSENGGYYLRYNNGLAFSTRNSTDWTYSNKQLYYNFYDYIQYYLRYNSGWSASTTQSNVYLYMKQIIDVTVETPAGEYTVVGDDKEAAALNGKVVTFTQTTYFTETESGEVTTNPTISATPVYQVMQDTNGILTLNSDGTATLTGVVGEAVIRVTYTWGDNNEYTMYDEFVVTAVEPVYTVVISDPTDDTVKTGDKVTLSAVVNVNSEALDGATVTWSTSNDEIATVDENGVVTGVAEGNVTITATYTDANGQSVSDSVTLNVAEAVYTVDIQDAEGVSVTKTIVKKSVTSDTTHVLSAAVTKDGAEVTLTTSNVKFVTAAERAAEGFTFDADTLYWTVNDSDIVSGIEVNSDGTVTVKFTGTKFGAVNISVIYNGKYDTVNLTTSSNEWYTTADGGDDFPQYPNPGSININKTATAVGNFSQTGIAQIELYGNGVPVEGSGPIDVVIMLDMTGSMTSARIEALNAATKLFIRNVVLNDDDTLNSNNIAVYYFNKDGATPIKTLGTVADADALASLESSIDTLIKYGSDAHVQGGTPYSTALQACQTVLEGSNSEYPDYCVFMSDGEPKKDNAYTDVNDITYSGDNAATSIINAGYPAEKYSSQMKEDGVTIYTVGLGITNANYQTIINNIASDESKAFQVADEEAASNLSNVFSNIASEIKQAASNVTVYDTITPEYELIFELPAVHSNGNNDPSLSGQEFYIEVVNYKLDANYNRTGAYDVLGRLYLTKDSSGIVTVSKYVAYTNVTNDTIASANATSLATTPTYTAVESGKAGYFNKNDDGTYTFVSGGKGAYNLTSGAVVYKSNEDGDLVIATQYFIYDEATKSFTWTTDKLGKENQIALRYFVYLTGSVEGLESADPSDDVESKAYPTNTSAWIAYTNHLDHLCYQYFPVPQLTWNGAQVTYVFYLVDDDGFPVNQAGTRINFSNAVEVTDRFTESLVWNNAEGKKSLDVTTIAEKVLPEYYTLYDQGAIYEIHVYENETGAAMGTNYFKISGSKAISGDDDGVTTDTDWTTKVYMDKSSTKYDAPGYYTATGNNVTDVNDNSVNASTKVVTGFDFADTTVAFAVLWTPELQSDTVVVDYGLDVIIDVTKNDFFNNSINGISANAPKGVTINTAVGDTGFGKGNITTDNYTVSIESANEVRFHQSSMEFSEPVTFYYDSAVKALVNGAPKDGYMYSSVTVIPATTVYYEDSFLTLNANGTEWIQEGTTVTDTQDADRPGPSKISADLDADNAYGYDSAYETMSQYSMGSAKKVHVDEDSYATAEFTFYGTGFDVIGLTSNQTGTLLVQVLDDSDKVVKSYFVDTYYGYTYNEDTDEWTVVNSGENALYQVPVMKVSGLTYGKYMAVIKATYNSFFEHVGEGEEKDGYDLYLDAIRIYDPVKPDTKVDDDTTIEDIYAKDGEGWPIYKELRNLVIDAAQTQNLKGISDYSIEGAVFIDGNKKCAEIATYANYGPNNELYLASGQGIAFTFESLPASLVDIQMAVKTVGGESSVSVFNPGTVTTTETVDGVEKETTTHTMNNKLTVDVKSATDMYYSILGQAADVTVDKDTDKVTAVTPKTVVIYNSGKTVISLTNLKFTFSEKYSGEIKLTVNNAEALAAQQSLAFYTNTVVVNTTIEEDDQVEEPKPEEPKPEEPKVEEPKPEEPKVEEPKPEEPKPEEPTVEEPKPEEPKPEEPTVEEPKPEEPKVEEPKPEEPKVEEPKPEEPKVEEPKPEEPKVEEPAEPAVEEDASAENSILNNIRNAITSLFKTLFGWLVG